MVAGGSPCTRTESHPAQKRPGADTAPASKASPPPWTSPPCGKDPTSKARRPRLRPPTRGREPPPPAGVRLGWRHRLRGLWLSLLLLPGKRIHRARRGEIRFRPPVRPTEPDTSRRRSTRRRQPWRPEPNAGFGTELLFLLRFEDYGEGSGDLAYPLKWRANGRGAGGPWTPRRRARRKSLFRSGPDPLRRPSWPRRTLESMPSAPSPPPTPLPRSSSRSRPRARPREPPESTPSSWHRSTSAPRASSISMTRRWRPAARCPRSSIQTCRPSLCAVRTVHPGRRRRMALELLRLHAGSIGGLRHRRPAGPAGDQSLLSRPQQRPRAGSIEPARHGKAGVRSSAALFTCHLK